MALTPTNFVDDNALTKALQIIKAELDAKSTLKLQTTTSLPSTGDSNVIYLVPITGSDRYEMWIYSNSTWHDLGPMELDLSNYWNGTNLIAMSNTDVQNIWDGLQ